MPGTADWKAKAAAENAAWEAKRAAEKKLTAEWMAKVKPLPAGLNEWAYRTVFAGQRHMRIEISKAERGKRWGVCLHCGWDGATKERIGVTATCPGCRTKVHTFSATLAKRSLQWPKRDTVSVVERIEGGLVVRKVDLFFDFRGRIHTVTADEAIRTIWTPDAKKPLQFVRSWEYAKGQYRMTGAWDYSPEYRGDVATRIYPPGLRALKASRFKWSGLIEWSRKHPEVKVERWLRAYVKCPCLEMLAKTGKDELVTDLLQDYNGVNGVYHAKTQDEMRKWFRIIRNANLNRYDVWVLGYLVAKKCNPTTGDMRILKASGSGHAFCAIIRANKGIGYRETLEYIGKGGQRFASDYTDYLQMARELGDDMTDPAVLRPVDMMKAHDDAVERKRAKRDAEYAADRARRAAEEKARNAKYEEAIKKAAAKNKALEVSMSGFVAILPKSVEDLTREGTEMHHCVGGYAARMAAGECLIVFVRAEQEPDMPLVTVELRNGKVVQARAKFNKAPPPEVEAVLKEMAESWSKPAKKAARRAV